MDSSVTHMMGVEVTDSCVLTDEWEVAVPFFLMPVSIDILKEDDIWICDSGASCHSTHNKIGAENERIGGVANVGVTGDAIPCSSTIDLSGRFWSRDGKAGM